MSFNKTTYLASLLGAKVRGSRKLLSLSLCVTNRCNIKCLYCYGDYYFRKEGHLGFSEIITVIDEACKRGLQHLYLTGGEPLIRSDIGQIIDHAAKKGLITGMVTNGYFLPRRIQDLLGLRKVILSLDGREEANDANRGESCFQKVAQAIDCCREHGLSFDLKMVLNRNNRGELPWMLDFAEKLGVELEVVLAYAPKSEIQKMQHGHLMLSAEERGEISKELLRLKREGRPLMFHAAVYENLVEWDRFHDKDMIERSELRDDFPYIRCNAGRFHAFIDGDGLMYPCNQLIGIFPAKHVIKDGFAAAWEQLAANSCSACNVTFLNHQHLSHDLFLTYLPKKVSLKLAAHGAPG